MKADPERPSIDALSPNETQLFRGCLADWYSRHARTLPWRGISDPYQTWVSEIMLQQTRVAAVIDHYERFLQLFPTLIALALAREDDVLAAWSGLGYYRRARMLHKAAQFVVREHGGQLPGTSAALRSLPGIGDYTAAAIASIAFGESIAVIDGNVERVLLRVLGRAEQASTAARAAVARVAAALVPPPTSNGNAPGDHNQAMMELGATICLPRGPLCLQCPVHGPCRTRGEHATLPRTPSRSSPAAYLLSTRKRGVRTELLLQRRPAEASLMPGMIELPPLSLDAIEEHEPVLRLRHAITNTNYYVTVHAETRPSGHTLRHALLGPKQDLLWHPVVRLDELPLTGLARKVVKRLRLNAVDGPETPQRRRPTR